MSAKHGGSGSRGPYFCRGRRLALLVGFPWPPFLFKPSAIALKYLFKNIGRQKFKSSLLKVMNKNILRANQPKTGVFYAHA
jgi:hypothetical protein